MPILYARFIWGLCLSGGQAVPCGIEGKDRRERVVSPIMLDKLVHNRWPRVGAALFGSLLLALAINLFIVPQHLYTSGLLGLCQVIRTLLDTKLGIRFSNFDLAGTLYLLANLPLLLLAYKTMGRTFVVKLALCTVFCPSSPFRRSPSSRICSPAAWWAASWRAFPTAWC